MKSKNLDCDTVIVGAGLSGLTAASLLVEAGVSTIVLEASSRIGGRIHSVRNDSTNEYLVNLGPTWVWPEYQPVAAQWLTKLNVESFAQLEHGEAVIDMGVNAPVTRQHLPGQYGIRRIVGGPQVLVDRLYEKLPADTVKTDVEVTAVRPHSNGIELATSNDQLPTLTAKQVVIAIPLRLAAQNIDWSNSLDQDILKIMRITPTWMATQAKAVAIYEKPFWRKRGLSGRIASRAGPIVEAHDHSGPQRQPAAIFGFLGWPHDQRKSNRDRLESEVLQQLIHCFGPEAQSPSALHIEDWATNPNVCSDMDLQTPPAHPDVLPNAMRVSHCDDRIYFAVAETAQRSPGLIEGALIAGASAATNVIRSTGASEQFNVRL